MSPYVFSLVLAAVLLGSILWLLRARQVSEKYAAIWIVLCLAVVGLVVFPGVAVALARATGVETPINFVFVVAILVLLLVAVHLSISLTAAEARSRTLTEEVALLRQEVVAMREGFDRQEPSPDSRPDSPR